MSKFSSTSSWAWWRPAAGPSRHSRPRWRRRRWRPAPCSTWSRSQTPSRCPSSGSAMLSQWTPALGAATPWPPGAGSRRWRSSGRSWRGCQRRGSWRRPPGPAPRPPPAGPAGRWLLSHTPGKVKIFIFIDTFLSSCIVRSVSSLTSLTLGEYSWCVCASSALCHSTLAGLKL